MVKRRKPPITGTGALVAGAVQVAGWGWTPGPVSSDVEECRKRFDAGDNAALLEAANLCAMAGTAMPQWLAEAFCARFLDWYLFQAKTLDEAFKITRKGKHTDKAARRERLRPRVAEAVGRLGLPIDEHLFRVIGAELHISGAVAREIYYEPATKRWLQFFAAARTSTKT